MRGVSERGPAINRRPCQIQNYASTKKCRFLSSGSSCFFQLYPPGFRVLDPIRIMRSLGGKAGSPCEEFEDNKDQILLGYVSESTGTSSFGLSQMKGY